MSVFTKSRKALAGVAIVGATALILAGCANGTTPTAGPTGDPAFDFPIDCSTAATSPYEHEFNSTSKPDGSELTFNIGTALPVTGNLAFLGPPEIAGTEMAAAEVNAANKGIKINLMQGDSGNTDNKAYETEVPRLLNAGATAIVGAASSGVSLQFIDRVIAAGAIMVSPANTSAAFTGYQDNGLYWRTAPSDVLQGEVLGNLIAADGAETLGFIIINDSYGTGLACFTKESFEKAGGKVVAATLYNDGDANFSSQISTVLAAAPDAIALITFDEVKTIVPELIAANVKAEQMYFVDGNLANFSTDFPAGTLTGAKGTYPAVDPSTITKFQEDLAAFYAQSGAGELKEFTYGPESYDAVILLALAALEAGSTEGNDVAAHMKSVSGGDGGTKCTTFAECADIINAGGQADYDGISGPITFNGAGDPTEAGIGVFQYGADNNYSWLRAG
jgi:branched-chain amino acid transport system substrate-binding protein